MVVINKDQAKFLLELENSSLIQNLADEELLAFVKGCSEDEIRYIALSRLAKEMQKKSGQKSIEGS